MKKRHGVLVLFCFMLSCLPFLRILFLNHLQLFSSGKQHHTADTRTKTRSTCQQILCQRCSPAQLQNTSCHRRNAKAHQKQARTVHASVKQIIMFPIHLLPCRPEPPRCGSSQHPGYPRRSQRCQNVPHPGESTVHTHRNQQEQRHTCHTDQIEPPQPPNSFRRFSKSEIRPDIDSNCFRPLFARPLHIFDLIVFRVFPVSQCRCSFNSAKSAEISLFNVSHKSASCKKNLSFGKILISSVIVLNRIR